jgi:hypothetical protein
MRVVNAQCVIASAMACMKYVRNPLVGGSACRGSSLASFERDHLDSVRKTKCPPA